MAVIRNIIFDFGGVLLEWNPRYLYRQVFTDEKEMEYFLAEVCPMAWNLSLDAGKPFAEGVRERQALYPQYSEQIAYYDTRWMEMLRGEIPEMVSVLQQVQQLGYHTFGLTNWSEEKFSQVYPLYPFLHTLEGIVVSGIEHTLKPEPRLYEILLERYNLRAEECVFIDDNPDNIRTAQALGFHAIQCVNPAQVREELAALLDQTLAEYRMF